MTVIVALSGKTGSGKSSVASALAAKLSAPFVSFGNFVRARAIALGLPNPTGRATLQPLGERLILELGWNEFCRAVLNQAPWDASAYIVVDGVRHAECISALRQIAPSRLVYLTVSDQERADRLRARGEITTAISDLHSTEIQVGDTLPAMADLLLNSADEAPEDLAQMIVSWLETSGSGS